MHECVAAIAGCGVSPLVRIAGNEGWMVKSTNQYPNCLSMADLTVEIRSPGLGRTRCNCSTLVHSR